MMQPIKLLMATFVVSSCATVQIRAQPNGTTDTSQWAPLPSCTPSLTVNNRVTNHFSIPAYCFVNHSVSVVNSQEELALAIQCNPDGPPLPVIDFSAYQLVLFRYSAGSHNDQRTMLPPIVSQGQTLSLVVNERGHCGGTPLPMMDFNEAVVFPRNTAQRSRTVSCYQPVSCSGPPRP